jgi:hypothetical protein
MPVTDHSTQAARSSLELAYRRRPLRGQSVGVSSTTERTAPPHPIFGLSTGVEANALRFGTGSTDGFFRSARCRLRRRAGGDPMRVVIADDSMIMREGLSRLLSDHAPRLRSIPKVEHQVWTSEQLQSCLRAAAGHRLFPAFRLAAATGMRRSELLGLRWNDIDLRHGIVSINRGLIAVAYELHETRGKTRNARRPVNLDGTTVEILRAWHTWQEAEQRAVGLPRPRLGVHRRQRTARASPCQLSSVRTDRHPSGPAAYSPARRPPRPRHPARPGRRSPQGRQRTTRPRHAQFTIETYQHVMLSMQADAVAVIEDLLGSPHQTLLPATASTGSTRLKRREKTA